MNCDASWAFASAGALEAYHAHFTGELVELSPQNLIDCDSLDNGCNGGFPFNAFEHVNNSGKHAIVPINVFSKEVLIRKLRIHMKEEEVHAALTNL